MEFKGFADVEEFADYMESLGQDLLAAGFSDVGQELVGRSRAYEIPMTGYYHELYSVLERTTAQYQELMPMELDERVINGVNYLSEIFKTAGGTYSK